MSDHSADVKMLGEPSQPSKTRCIYTPTQTNGYALHFVGTLLRTGDPYENAYVFRNTLEEALALMPQPRCLKKSFYFGYSLAIRCSGSLPGILSTGGVRRFGS